MELASPSDDGPRGITALRQKMAAYQRNATRLDGSPHFPALVLELEEIWAG
ncbi:MAG: hypothetical protein VKK98_08995 [Cyanobacteriota bacterium]|nr:hypothetical protein [Cyanobacteriota bacterium]